MPSGARVPSTRTRYSFSTEESSPISCFATRPSWVSTSSPVESMSSRPAGSEPPQVFPLELDGRGIRRPAILRADQHDGGFVAVFGLAGDAAHRLVQQDGDLSALVFACGPIDLDARVGWHPYAERVDDLAIHFHPAAGDPAIRLAP